MDYVDLIIFAVVVGAGLLFGDKNKKRRATGRSAGADPRERLHTRAQMHATVPRRPGGAIENARSVAERIFERLQQEQGMVERAGGSEPERDMLGQVIETRPVERAVSLETLEAAGEASHERFHEKYIRPDAGVPHVRIRHLHLTPRTARDAIVWMEVLGTPKGMRG